MALASYLSGDETFFHCLAPTCKAGQLHPEGPLEPIFSCAVCKTRSCVACRTLWHDGRTCEEHQQDLKEALDRDIAAKKAEEERKAQEIASEEAIRVLSKVCPNGSCGARIEKNGGCDHMTVSAVYLSIPRETVNSSCVVSTLLLTLRHFFRYISATFISYSSTDLEDIFEEGFDVISEILISKSPTTLPPRLFYHITTIFTIAPEDTLLISVISDLS